MGICVLISYLDSTTRPSSSLFPFLCTPWTSLSHPSECITLSVVNGTSTFSHRRRGASSSNTKGEQTCVVVTTAVHCSGDTRPVDPARDCITHSHPTLGLVTP